MPVLPISLTIESLEETFQSPNSGKESPGEAVQSPSSGGIVESALFEKSNTSQVFASLPRLEGIPSLNWLLTSQAS